MAAGPAVGALLAERSFTLLFVIDALTSVMLGVVALWALPETRAAATATAPEGPRGSALGILGDRAFVLFLLGMTVANVIGFQLGVVMPLHVTGAGHSVATYGMLVSLNCVLVVVLEVPLTRWTRRMRPERAIAAGHLLCGLGYALLVGVAPVWAMASAVAVLTAGEMLAAPVSSAYVATLAPAHARGRYMGAFGLTFAAGLTLAPLAGTSAWQLSPPLFCAGCASLGVAAAGLTLLSARVRHGYGEATRAQAG